MQKLKDAAEVMKRISAMFSALNLAAEEIQKLESLDNHVQELENKKNELISGNEALSKQLAEVSTELESKQAEAAQILIDAENAKKEIISQAKANLAKLVEMAEKESEVVKQEKQKIIVALDEELGLAKSSLEALNLEIEEKSKKLVEVQEALDKIKGGI